MVKKKPMDEMSFEDALNKLKEHAKILESDELDLDKALQGYEDAVGLASRCLELLKDAEDRVKMISQSGSGKLVLEDFDRDIEIDNGGG